MVHRWSTRGRKGSFFVVNRRTKKSLEDFVIIRNSKNFENLGKVLKSAHNPKVRGSNPLPATNFNQTFLFDSPLRAHSRLIEIAIEPRGAGPHCRAFSPIRFECFVLKSMCPAIIVVAECLRGRETESIVQPRLSRRPRTASSRSFRGRRDFSGLKCKFRRD